jgi:hypothetical protein
MSNISTLGETLSSFICPHFPGFIQELNPGISRSAIQLSLTDLDQPLPNDFHELYEWKNGSLNGFPRPFNLGEILEFSPIEFVREDIRWEFYGDDIPSYKGFQLLPFIKDSDSIAIALGSNYSEEAHIVYVTHVCEVLLFCDSITSMLTSTVECFTSGYIVIGNEGIAREDHHLCAEVWRRNNPHTIAEVISKLTLSINVCISEASFSMTDEEYSGVIDSLTSALATLSRYRPPEAITLIQDNLINLKRNNSARGGGLHLTLDQWLEEVVS